MGELMDSNGYLVNGKSIRFVVKRPDGTNIFDGYATTNADGLASINFTPDVAGEYAITASFAGDSEYESSAVSDILTAQLVCSPGDTRSPTTCWDGSTIYGEVCNPQGSGYVPSGASCPVETADGAVRNIVYCWDGTTIQSQEVYSRTDHLWHTQTFTCPTEPLDGATRNVIYCTDGTTVSSQEIYSRTTHTWSLHTYTCPVVTRPVRYTWQSGPTSIEEDTENKYTILLEGSTDGGESYVPMVNANVTYTFTPSAGEALTLQCITNASGVCGVNFTPRIAGTWSVEAAWDCASAAYDCPTPATLSIDVTASCVPPATNLIRLTWQSPPTSINVGVETNFTALCQNSTDSGTTWHNVGNTGLHYEFTSPDGTLFVADCTTPSGGNGMCSVSLRPLVEGIWSARVRWDWNNCNYPHIWSNTISFSVVSVAATATTLALAVSDATPAVGSDVTMVATLSNASTSAAIPGQTVEFEFHRPDGTFAIYNVATNSSGQAALTENCAQAGAYTVYATFYGNA
ncbi:MAG: hypothetical protein WC554_16085, partial [Clostridia bacterium]